MMLAPTLAAARAALPPEGANPALGRPGGGVVAPMLAAARAALPPEGANPALGRPGGGVVACWLGVVFIAMFSSSSSGARRAYRLL